MPHGAPDWNIYRPQSRSYSTADLAEHAARIGSIVTFDRRGDVYHAWDFSAGWGAWVRGASGGSAAFITLSPLHLTGGYSAELVATTTATPYAQIELISPSATTRSFGVSLLFSCFNVYDTFRIRFIVDDGVRQYDARVRHDFGTARLELYDVDGNWLILPTPANPTHIEVQTDEHMFYYIKLVVDAEKKRYDRLQFNEHIFPLTAHCLLDWGPGGLMGTTTNLRLDGRFAASDRINIDNVILTQDEPCDPIPSTPPC